MSSGDARAQERRVTRHGGDYLDGKIMADPHNVGTSRASFDFSGAENVFRTHEATLQLLGDVSYYGDDQGAAAVQFQAQVGMGYELLIGFLHTVRLVAAEGLEPEKFAERFAGSLSGYAALLPMMAKAVTNTEYAPDLGPLTVQAPLMDDLIEHRVAVGVGALRMREVKRLMDLRIAQGHGDEGFSGLFEVLDQESATKGSGV